MAGGPSKKLVSMKLDATDAAAHGGSSVMIGDKVVGTVTSGDWGYRTQMNLAYAFVEPDLASEGTSFHVDVLGTMVPATVIEPGPYDPSYSHVRS